MIFLKKQLLGLFLLVSLLVPSNLILAQSVSSDSNPDLFTQIQSSDHTEINSPIIFTARPQFNLEDHENVQFNWDFNDGNTDQGKEVAHSFSEAGTYTITLTTTTDQEQFKQTKDIFVAFKSAAFITDQQKHIAKIDNFLNIASSSNVYLTLTESFTSQSEFLSEEVLARKLIKQEESISKLDTIIVWTQGNAGLNALSRFKQSLQEEALFSNTTIVLLKDDIDQLQRVKRQFTQLKPKEIIVIPEEALYLIGDHPSTSDLKHELRTKQIYKYEIIDQQNVNLSKLSIFTFFLDFLTDKGIPDNTIILILLLPVIATVIAFMKQVIGITTLGIYIPTIITLTFLVLGLEFGVILMFFVVMVGTLAHKLVKPFKLLYIPKMALVVTFVSIVLFLLLTLTVYLDLFDIEFISLAIFPVVIMGTLTEKFVTLRTEKGISGSVLIMIETFFVALVAYIITGGNVNLYFFEFQFNFIKNLLLNTPEIIFIFILVNYYLGRWTGLLVTEYFNFREIINSNTEE